MPDVGIPQKAGKLWGIATAPAGLRNDARTYSTSSKEAPHGASLMLYADLLYRIHSSR